MKLALTYRTPCTLQPPPDERASARVILLALVSFLLGVAATAGWFQLAAKRNVQPSVPPPVNQPADESDAQPAARTTFSARPAGSVLPPVTPAAIEEVKQAILDLANVSEADAENTLRAAALKEFTAAAKEADTEVKAAQQQLVQAQNGGSAADQQAVMKKLQQAQSTASEKLQQIAARLQSQIVALKSLKNNP
ncbi:MAG TPA: hypothetical protein VIK53_08985 [Verrucomicrobiae bacterium]